jgi:hypothetical protein
MTATVAQLMPRVKLGPFTISRLIVGGNPFSANSHYTPALDSEMRDYHSAARILETLHRCERWGISAWQSRGDNHMMRLYHDHRIAGGSLLWIAQTASEHADIKRNIANIARAGAAAIYHHGTRTDSLWQEGRIEAVREYLQAIRDSGALVGLGTHIPEVIDYSESHGWDVDFYMACLYNLSRERRESPLVSGQPADMEQFVHTDRDLMCRVICQTDKTCLAFKVLAASRLSHSRAELRSALSYAFSHIKPNDAIVVGMFDKYSDQVAENARLTFELGQVNEAPRG